jgi:hypothetical protein
MCCAPLGRPGVGKTTAIREVSRTLGDDLSKRVVIVDTSNEIGGDGDIPHPGIGRARRMQVRFTWLGSGDPCALGTGQYDAGCSCPILLFFLMFSCNSHQECHQKQAIPWDPPRNVPSGLPSQVPNPEEQHRVMIEAVENHMPEVGGWGRGWWGSSEKQHMWRWKDGCRERRLLPCRPTSHSCA